MTTSSTTFAWPNDPKATQIYLFCEMVKEATSTESYESFRSVSLDNYSRISEAIDILSQVESGKLKAGTAKPVIEELAFFLEFDLALASICPDEVSYFIHKRGQSNYDILRICKAIELAARNSYYDKVKELIEQYIGNTKEKYKLRQLVSNFVSYSLSLGYSRSYILESINVVFFDKQYKRMTISKVRQFFSLLNGKDKEFRCIIGINPSLNLFFKSLGKNDLIDSQSLPKFITDAMRIDSSLKKYRSFVPISLAAKDKYSASLRASMAMRNMSSIYKIESDKIRLDFAKNIYIFEKPSDNQIHHGEFIMYRSRQPIHIKHNVKNRTSITRSYMSSIFEKYKDVDSNKIFRAIDGAIHSSKYNDPKTILVNYWSAFETILEQPKDGEIRIEKYMKDLIPSICINYVHRCIDRIHQELVTDFGANYSNLIDQSNTEQQQSYKYLFDIIVLGNDHKKLFNVINLSPNTMNKIFMLHERFSSPESTLKQIIKHEKLVEWQISRIYRARNSIIHSGQDPQNIDSLILNSRDYFKIFIKNILFYPYSSPVRYIDESVSGMRIKHSITKQKLEESNNWSKIDAFHFLPQLLGA